MALCIFLHLCVRRKAQDQMDFDVLLSFLQIKNIDEYRYSEAVSVQLSLASVKLFIFWIPSCESNR